MKNQPNFTGIATAYNILCTDGRSIAPGSFSHQDGKKVPLMFQHNHNDQNQVLGHAMLYDDADVMYADCYFNDTPQGKNAEELVKHGDIDSLSIHANHLKYANGSEVIHGDIQEVSLVLSGANSGAKIINDTIKHGDGMWDDDDSSCIIHSGYTNKDMEDGWDEGLYHDDDDEDYEEDYEDDEDDEDFDEEAYEDAIIDSLTDEQAAVVAARMVENLDNSNLGGDQMKHGNLFAGEGNTTNRSVLSHSDITTILGNVKSAGSLRNAITDFANQNKGHAGISELSHAGTYGIDNIEYLFPEFKEINATPDFIKRDTTWVDGVLNGTSKRPFSRIKMTHADITADEARAKGYTKGNLKTEEVFELLHRTVGPTWVYKKQKLDQEDIIEITDFNVVNWLWSEMNVMLREEIARAMLLGDGRPKLIDGKSNPDKIDEKCIIPVCAEAPLYCIKHILDESITEDPSTSDEFVKLIEEIILARKDYKGTGQPTLYVKHNFINMLRIKVKDNFGQYVYRTKAEVCAMLDVKDIVEIEVFDRVETDETSTNTLIGILVNLQDYTMGINKGGEVTKFSDFDIDFNQHKYLAETYFSGALTKPHSAISFWSTKAAE